MKDAYMKKELTAQREQQNGAKLRTTKLRARIQERVVDGRMSFAEAAQAESDMNQEEAKRAKGDARSNFDLFEVSFALPINTLLTERLQKADSSIAQLRQALDARNDNLDPNQAQEEGDEQPERLERLTLFKWLFECREQLHKEMFDLHAERSAKYAEVILTPYRVSGLQGKIDEATAFFSKDTRDRQVHFAKSSAERYEQLQAVVDVNVSRGVEDQLSAFWDIAPGLLEVIQPISASHDVGDMEIAIPERELAENPSYHQYPWQYLYSLLSHAGRSAHQYIESQVNLLCLLHEVRTAAMKARARLAEIERSGSDGAVPSMDIAEVTAAEEGRLTRDLKDKVGEVERQWQEALGNLVDGCKGRVRVFLETVGGWEESLER